MIKPFRLLKNFVLRTNDTAILRLLYVYIYILARKIIAWYLMRLPGVVALHARGGTLKDTDIPGDSDIDFIVLTTDLNPQEEQVFFMKLSKRCSFLSSVFPFFKHIKVLSVDNFKLYFSLKQLQSLPPFRFYSDYVRGTRIQTTPHNVKVSKSNLLSLIFRKHRDLTQELLLLPDKQLLRHFMKYTDYIAEWALKMCELHKTQNIDRLRERNAFAKKARYRIADINNYALETWCLTSGVLNHLCNCVDDYEAEKGDIKLGQLSFTRHTAPQQTRGEACEKFQTFINKLGKHSRQIESVILNSHIGSNYQYFLYIILTDTITEGEEKDVIAHVVKTYSDVKDEFKHCVSDSHLILTKCRFNFCVQHTMLPGGSLETLNMLNNAVTLFGADLVKKYINDTALNKLPIVTKWDFVNNIILSAPIASNPFKNLVFAFRLTDKKLAITSLDIILGGLPTRRLLLEQGIITMTPEQALYEYAKIFRDEPETEMYKNLYDRFYSEHLNGIDLDSLTKDLPLIYRVAKKNSTCIEREVRSIVQNYAIASY